MTTLEPNDLEECYRLASESGDDAKLLRALSRNVLYMAVPKDGTPVGQVTVRHYEPGEKLLPTAPGVDGRTYVLAFSSYQPMADWYGDPELAWTMEPAGRLASTWPNGAPLLLTTPTGAVVVEADDMRTVALLFAEANVREAFQPGPATPVGLKGAGDRAGRLLRRPPPGCGRAPRDHGRRLGTGTTRRARSARLADHRSHVRRRRGRRGDAAGCELVRSFPGAVRRVAGASARAGAR